MSNTDAKLPGYNTGNFGKQLTALLHESVDYRAWHVYYDHGDKLADSNVVAIKGYLGNRVTRLNWLADVDILVASDDGVAKFVIEIEERNSSPKKILGDAMASLMCDHFSVKIAGEEKVFSIDTSTRLIIAGIVPDHGYRLRKINEVISPRINELNGYGDGILPKNVELVFAKTIDETLLALQEKLSFFGKVF